MRVRPWALTQESEKEASHVEKSGVAGKVVEVEPLHDLEVVAVAM